MSKRDKKDKPKDPLKRVRKLEETIAHMRADLAHVEGGLKRLIREQLLRKYQGSFTVKVPADWDDNRVNTRLLHALGDDEELDWDFAGVQEVDNEE